MDENIDSDDNTLSPSRVTRGGESIRTKLNFEKYKKNDNYNGMFTFL